jgi:hypothetical protein
MPLGHFPELPNMYLSRDTTKSVSELYEQRLYIISKPEKRSTLRTGRALLPLKHYFSASGIHLLEAK